MLSIIIPTLNEEEWIGKLLTQLKEQVREGDEIIVVDSESEDRTVEIAERFGARVIRCGRNGKGEACTLGAKHAKNDIVVFLDADCIIAGDYLERIRSHFKKGVVAVGGLDLYLSESRPRKWLYDTYSKGVFYLSKIHNRLTKECCFPSNNAAFKREAFLACGGYRSVVCEEADLMRRFKSHNVIYDPRLVVLLSDRRFKQHGFLNTLALWAKGHLKLILEDGLKSHDYKKGY